LIRTRYEIFTNPYYNDCVDVEVEPFGEWEELIDKLTEKLLLTCKENP